MSERLTDAERKAIRNAGLLNDWPHIFGAVERIVAARVAEALEVAAVAVETKRSKHWQKHLRDHPLADAKSCPADYAKHDAYYDATRIVRALAADRAEGAS